MKNLWIFFSGSPSKIHDPINLVKPKNSFSFFLDVPQIMLVLLVFFASCGCEETSINGISFNAYHTNLNAIIDGRTITQQDADYYEDFNPVIIQFHMNLNWEPEFPFSTSDGCMEVLNEVTSFSLTCDKDFILRGQSYSAGSQISDSFESGLFYVDYNEVFRRWHP